MQDRKKPRSGDEAAVLKEGLAPGLFHQEGLQINHESKLLAPQESELLGRGARGTCRRHRETAAGPRGLQAPGALLKKRARNPPPLLLRQVLKRRSSERPQTSHWLK